MQYCPKCKTEYEDHVTQCADCEIDLVPDLSEHIYYKPLIKVKTSELEELISYLEYSGIDQVETETQEDEVIVSVGDMVYEEAMNYLQVYVREHMEESNVDDYYINEYEVEEVPSEDKVSDMKSTVVTFGGVGLIAIVFSAINYLGVIDIKGFNTVMLSVVTGAVGLIFIGIAIKTRMDMNEIEDDSENVENSIQNVMNWYRDEKGVENIFSRHKIERESIDEGALYFVVFDIIKDELKAQYPETKDTILNSAAERLYDEL